MLDVKNLSVDFKTPDGTVAAVKQMTFSLEAGSSLGVVGESGSGKSQAMLAMLGLLANNGQSKGQVFLDGQELLSSKAFNLVRGVRIGMIFQDPMTSLNPYLKIQTQMTEVLFQHTSMSRGEAYETCLKALERVHIDQAPLRLTQYPHELSGGMRQRVAIAMALLCDPQVLIADEPTTALDVTVQAEILKLLLEIKRTSNTSIVLISHDLAVVSGLCDDVLVMHQGQIMEYGDVEQIFYRPQHTYTQGLLAAIPTLNTPSGERLKVVGEAPLESITPASKVGGVMLKVENLQVHFHLIQGVFGGKKTVIRAVDGISFEVKAGETLGIVGESGSGKSTLARAIIGLVPLTQGQVELDGKHLTGLSPKERHKRCREIQMIFQDPLSSLNPRMTVGEILAEPLRTHFTDLDEPEIEKRVIAGMQQVGLSGSELNRYPHEYSGGQCQRIGIARALMTKPKLIICDEPVSALDVSIQAQVVNLLRDLQKAFGLTLIFIAHDISVVKNISQRMLVMHGGKVVEMGDTEQICNHPNHGYTQALLSAVPIPDPKLQKSRLA